MLSSIDHAGRLYVLDHGKGYTCLGFDVAEKWLLGVLAWMPAQKRPIVCAGETEIGTAGRYAFFERVMDAGGKHATATATQCPANLIPQLIGLERKRVEVTLPNGERSRFYVGKSTGWLPIHLERKRSTSRDGGSVYFPEGATVRVVR